MFRFSLDARAVPCDVGVTDAEMGDCRPGATAAAISSQLMSPAFVVRRFVAAATHTQTPPRDAWPSVFALSFVSQVNRKAASSI